MKHKDTRCTVENGIIRQEFECIPNDRTELAEFLTLCLRSGKMKGRDVLCIATEFCENGGLYLPVMIIFGFEDGILKDYRVGMALHAELLQMN